MTRVNNLLWQLHADLLSRLNQLIDECAHIQSTIKSHLGSFHPNDDTTDWIPAPDRVRDEDYYFLTPQDRALRNLYVSAGALGASLTEHGDRAAKYFEAVLSPTPSSKRETAQTSTIQADSPALYWYISYRGHVLGHVFGRALRQLQHAQEKLIQVLENSPAQIPSPTLLRRWSSGGNAEYLSEYSRNVNACVQRLMRAFLGHDDSGDPLRTRFDAWRARRFLTHTWSHTQTSQTTSHRYRATRDSGATSVVTVWSSYFYLEQPTLFPLLYHECAHHYITSDENSESDALPSAQWASLWTNTVRETAELLSRASPIQAESINSWYEIVEEFVADTLSVTLANGSFLTALVLQIFGLQTQSYRFSDFNLETKAPVELNNSGDQRLRLLEVEYPNDDVDYFWEARLQIACEAIKKLGRRTQTDVELVAEIEDLLTAYRQSGAIAHSAELASNEHAAMWHYREKLNTWLRDVVKDCLHDFTERLRDKHVQELAREHSIDPEVKKVIVEDAENVWRIKFECGPPREFCRDFLDHEHYRPQDVCYVLRWQFGCEVVRRLERATDSERVTWSHFYPTVSAYDASVGFRIAQEAQAITASVYQTAAELLRREGAPPSDLSPAEQSFATSLLEAALADQRESKLEKHDFAVLLAKMPPARDRNSQIGEQAAAVLGDFLASLRRNGRAHIVPGSLTLGVLRTSCLSTLGFAPAFSTLAGVSRRRVDERNEALRKHGFGHEAGSLEEPRLCAQVMPLFGEYNYFVFNPGVTPLNRNTAVPTDGLVMMSKPRFALELGAQDRQNYSTAGLAKVSQISFRYQWQWVKLARAMLDESPAQVFLSGGWEDVVLVSYHKNLDAHAKFVEDHKLTVRSWMDIHSSLALPRVPEQYPTSDTDPPRQVAPDHFARTFPGTVEEREVWDRTGRYDVTVVWKGQPSVDGLWKSLCAIDRGRWAIVESMSTSLQDRAISMPDTSSTGVAPRQTHSRRFVSQFVLRHVH